MGKATRKMIEHANHESVKMIYRMVLKDGWKIKVNRRTEEYIHLAFIKKSNTSTLDENWIWNIGRVRYYATLNIPAEDEEWVLM